MKSIGETIRSIRKQKKLTQEIVYDGIVSRNFASRFENGHSNIEANKLFLILNRLDISASEFQFIHFDNEDYQFKEVLSKIDHASQKGDYKTINNIYGKYKLDFNLTSQVIAATAYLKIYVHGNNPLKLTLEPVYPLQVHLLETSDWSLFEFRLFVDGIFIFRKEPNELSICLNKAIDAYKKYSTFSDVQAEVEQNMASIILNYVQIKLVNFSYDEARIYNNSDLFNNISDFTAQLTIKFSILLSNLYCGDNTVYDDTKGKMEEFLTALKILNFSDQSVFSKIYNYHLPISAEHQRKSKMLH